MTQNKGNIISALSATNRPFVIAGPCSAETEHQVLETARQLKKINKSQVYRSGIWKPRTRPDSFEGVGKKGLPWLQKVKKETGLLTTVEVANSQHVELCLKHEIDILWIGARTTVNPFTVQELANALKGVEIPVLVKNPVNPDLALWLGAVERLQKAGISDLGVIHRGFSSVGERVYRNRPQWQIAIECMRALPEIPMICDPSHICGRRDILKDVSQKAMDLGYNGLMIETHIDPDQALSDAQQQITPEAFNKLIRSLVIRSDCENNSKLQSQLERMRSDIDLIDEEIINLLSNRMNIAREIGHYKKDKGITIFQPKRWNDIIRRATSQAKQGGLSLDFIRKYLNGVHDESIDQQSRVMQNGKELDNN